MWITALRRSVLPAPFRKCDAIMRDADRGDSKGGRRHKRAEQWESPERDGGNKRSGEQAGRNHEARIK